MNIAGVGFINPVSDGYFEMNEKENAGGYFEKAFQLSGSQSEKQLLPGKITLC